MSGIEISLEGKVAVITGAANGNGYAISDILLEAGAECLLIDIDELKLVKVAENFKKRGHLVKWLGLDLSCSQSFIKLEKFINKNYKKIDYLINNAGYTKSYPFVDYPEVEWKKTFAVNLEAPFRLSKLVCRHMPPGGAIVNITSLASELGFPNNVAYVSSKGGLRQLSKSMAVDLAPLGIRVNSIGPGYIKTNMTSLSWSDNELRNQRTNRTLMNKWGDSHDVAKATLFMVSELSSYITGQNLYVDGGWMAKGL